MAFADETDRLRVSEALEITPEDFSLHLLRMGPRITATIEERVLELLTQFEAQPVDAIEIHPKEANQGVSKNKRTIRTNLQSRIATLLGLEGWAGMQDSYVIVRG